MAETKIIQKLKDEMCELPIRRESQVVNVLTEIRKYLEHSANDPGAQYPSLKFFCDWAVHSKIDRKSSAQRIQELCDAFDLHNIHSKRLIDSVFLKTMMLLSPLRRDLSLFFDALSIPSYITTNQLEWYRFIYHYSGVVTAAPLVVNRQVSLDQVKEVRVSRIKSREPGWPDYIHWHVVLGDGTPRYASILLGQKHDILL